MPNKPKNPHAVALGSLGGKKRAENLSAEEISAIARKAGKARLTQMSKAERKRIAMLGVEARKRKRKEKSE